MIAFKKQFGVKLLVKYYFPNYDNVSLFSVDLHYVYENYWKYRNNDFDSLTLNWSKNQYMNTILRKHF